ncbi:GPI ethanolamine phosphate transferase 1-like [Littorina saxatilis]|uniref:GPI ethanolamine phosphate transferase 1 n=1 Tax=Littorina saxatilis TaxID=31220 RepID=A0AAN9GMS8_9CAEN
MKVWQVIVAGVVVHLILFYSIFDIYFTSPLVHGMTPYTSRSVPPAKRLVLFVADGLRADKFFELDEGGRPRAPYLRKVIEEQGAWGVSHTRVPTESRPGHVALIAGFYEDVSAVAKGWKENPVEFDSVFNESRNTWSWGSPDILPMFAKGATGDHVTINCYPAHFEDFAGSDMTQLDLWVFKAVKRFFESAEKNATLMNALQKDKLVFFLHLLGIDTNGHSNKPHSEEYVMNIKVVDAGVQKVVQMLDNFFNEDGKTAYVMTSDHGMTNWGSHGAGHPSETLTPLVAWGAGVRQSLPTDGSCGQFPDNFCNDWRLQHLKRVDVSQADVAPLMSFLVGVPFPVNSVGVLPVNYLGGSDFEKAEGLFANAGQILAQYQVKMTQVQERTISVSFRPFPDLSASAQVDLMRNIRNLINNGRYSDAINESKFVIDTALKGLRYYQTYDRFFLGISVTLGFLGWMGYVLHLIVADHTIVGPSTLQGKSLGAQGGIPVMYHVFATIGVLVALLLYVQSLPWTYYLYCLTPVLLWMKFAQGWNTIYAALKGVIKEAYVMPMALSTLFCFLGLEITVMSFFYRELLSVGLVGMAFWAISTPLWNTHRTTCLCWMTSCLLMAVFPLLPVVGGSTNYPVVLLSGVLSFLLGIYMIWRLWDQNGSIDTVSKTLLCIQVAVIAIATIIVKVTSDRIAVKTASPFFTQALSWIILCVSPLLPLLTDISVDVRLLSLGLAFMAPYILTSITYEGLFLLSLVCVLYSWLQMETHLEHLDSRQARVVSFRSSRLELDKKGIEQTPRHLHIGDLRRVFFFIFLITTAFFGTGNIASINSFDPASVYCFLTVFNPFVMGAIMMTKVLLPFLVVTCMLRAVQVVTRIPLRALMLLVMLMSDVMGLNFFFLVRDYGSWLEIGTSISHYVICMSMIIFVMVLMGLSQLLTSGSVRRKA